jgi:hypothetical protein
MPTVSLLACAVPLASVVCAGVLAFQGKKGWGWFLGAAVVLFGLATMIVVPSMVFSG